MVCACKRTRCLVTEGIMRTMDDGVCQMELTVACYPRLALPVPASRDEVQRVTHQRTHPMRATVVMLLHKLIMILPL
jgi:hypothetical protein